MFSNIFKQCPKSVNNFRTEQFGGIFLGFLVPLRRWIQRKRKRKRIISNANVKNQHKKNVCFELWGDFIKNRMAQRLGVYRGCMNKVITMLYKT